MYPENVGSTETDIVILRNEPATDGFRKCFPRATPPIYARLLIPIRASYVNHHHGFVVQSHVVEHLGLNAKVPNAFVPDGFVGTIQHNELRGMKGQPDV